MASMKIFLILVTLTSLFARSNGFWVIKITPGGSIKQTLKPKKITTTTTTTTTTTITTTTTTTTTTKICRTKTSKNCIFPFIYHETIYSGCTNDSFPTEWCAISLYDTGHVKYYALCKGTCRSGETQAPSECKTVNGEKCTFPFKYNNVEYTECTLAGASNPWCAITLHDQTSEAWSWGYCNSVCTIGATPDSTLCLTLNNQACVFPFTYYGVNYTQCTDVGNAGVKWCAITVTSSQQADGWGNCKSTPQCG